MKLIIEKEVSDATLRKAIELRISECFPAMNFANALGGTQTDAWRLVRQFSAIELFEEAERRGLPLTEFKGSVGGPLITESPLYQVYLKGKQP